MWPPQGSFLPRALSYSLEFFIPKKGIKWKRRALALCGWDSLEVMYVEESWKREGDILLTKRYRCVILPLLTHLPARRLGAHPTGSRLADGQRRAYELASPACCTWTIEEWKAEQTATRSGTKDFWFERISQYKNSLLMLIVRRMILSKARMKRRTLILHSNKVGIISKKLQ